MISWTDHADLDTKHQVLITGIDLDHDEDLTIEYTAQVPLERQLDGLLFALELDGGEGPDQDTFMVVEDSTLTVTVTDAKAGSGMAHAVPTGDVIVASAVEAVTITYTAIGEIGEKKKITVTVPDDWSPPKTEADVEGSFTVEHYEKPAEDAEPDADPVAGSSLDAASVEKVAGATADDDATIMVATVKSEASLLAGDTVVFTYSGGIPTALGPSYFTTTYGGEPVEDSEVKVLVESGKPASALAIVVDGFTIEDGPATVTVKLLDPDGESATRSTPTTVDLIASSGTIVSVTIPAGEYSMDTTLSAEEAANITITATATGLTDAEPLTVLADTNSPSIDADSITADPMYAKEGTVVTVSATGTKARAANTVLFSIHRLVRHQDLSLVGRWKRMRMSQVRIVAIT